MNIKEEWFSVIVGNIGTVYHGNDWKEAGKTYRDYVKASRSCRGRAGGESVTMLGSESILDHYQGITE